MRVRKIREWGSSMVLVFAPADKKDLKIEAGDEVDIEDIIIIKKKNERRSKE